MAPQIVEDVIDWIFGKRRRKNSFYGGRSSWAVPGYGNSGSRRERSFDPVLQKRDNRHDIAEGPTGQIPKVINFDDGLSIDDDAVEQSFADIDDTDQELQDTDSGFSLVDDDDDSKQGFSDIYDKSFLDEKPGDKETLEIIDESSFNKKSDSEEKMPDIDDKYYVDEITGIRVLRFEDTESPVKKEGPISQTASKVTPVREITPYIKSPDNTKSLVVTESLVSMKLYKEGNMSDTHFIAHNENESNLVQRMHPDCRVMVPDDYDGAIEEIMTCPLECPYKVLELTEVDQKTLRNRLLK